MQQTARKYVLGLVIGDQHRLGGIQDDVQDDVGMSDPPFRSARRRDERGAEQQTASGDLAQSLIHGHCRLAMAGLAFPYPVMEDLRAGLIGKVRQGLGDEHLLACSMATRCRQAAEDPGGHLTSLELGVQLDEFGAAELVGRPSGIVDHRHRQAQIGIGGPQGAGRQIGGVSRRRARVAGGHRQAIGQAGRDRRLKGEEGNAGHRLDLADWHGPQMPQLGFGVLEIRLAARDDLIQLRHVEHKLSQFHRARSLQQRRQRQGASVHRLGPYPQGRQVAAQLRQGIVVVIPLPLLRAADCQRHKTFLPCGQTAVGEVE